MTYKPTFVRKTFETYLTYEEAQDIIKGVPKDRDRLLLRVLWETGARVSEVNCFTPEHIDPRTSSLILKNLKQKKKKEIIPLKRVFLFVESSLIKDLLTYCSEEGIKEKELLFPSPRNSAKPVGEVYIWRLVTKIAKKLSIKKIKGGDFKEAWPHLFRHGAAMWILKRTGRLDVVRDQLGHRFIATTESYAGLTEEDRGEIIRKSVTPT